MTRTWQSLLCQSLLWLSLLGASGLGVHACQAAEMVAGQDIPGGSLLQGESAVPIETITAAGIVLAPGDQIIVKVYDNPDLERSFRVGRDPANFPLVGDLGPLAGLSPVQIEKLITDHLAAGYLVRPVVSVSIFEFTQRYIAVIGSVKIPQRVSIDPHVTVSAWQLLAQAGGLAEDADRSKIMVLRIDPRVEGKIELLVIEFREKPGSTDDVRLKPGDTLIVPRLDRAVYVLGEVKGPGPVRIEEGMQMTVAAAISLRGGFERFARKSKVQLLRDGQTTIIDVQAILDGNVKDDVALRPGDVVFVPESLF